MNLISLYSLQTFKYLTLEENSSFHNFCSPYRVVVTVKFFLFW